MKRILSLLLIVLLVLPLFSLAEGIDLMSYAKANLTEVYGYTNEEAEQFVFGEQEDDTLSFWPPDHPDWIYTVFIDRKTGQISGTSPFDTGYFLFRGENAVSELIHTAYSKKWFGIWDDKAREALLSLLDRENIRISTELYFAQQGGNAVHGFFESLYGPELGWPEPLVQLHQTVMDDYHLTREPEPFHLPGIRETVHVQPSGSVRTMTLFEGEIPEKYRAVLSDPHLEGWQCSSGAVVTLDWNREEGQTIPKDTGAGLVAFEKDGRRQLIQLAFADDGWKILPLGENALYQTGDYKVTYDGLHESFAIVYPLSEVKQAAFYVTPLVHPNNGETSCTINAYECLNQMTWEAVWISVASTSLPTWKREQLEPGYTIKARFPEQLGLVSVELFPVEEEEAINRNYPGLADDYVLVNGVNFRTQTDSRSRSYGELKPGTAIPVLDVVPGEPEPWIHTRIGTLEGYVVSNYTSWGGQIHHMVAPQPVGKAKKEITLKRGKGLFDGSAGTFPAGTKMHIILEDGDWLYVDIPQREMNWLMDPEGTFGYIRRNDIVQASTACQLDWMDE